MLVYFGAIYNVFYPKALPNDGYCVAPVFEVFGIRKGVLGPFMIFRHVAQMQRASRHRWGNLGLIGFSDAVLVAIHMHQLPSDWGFLDGFPEGLHKIQGGQANPKGGRSAGGGSDQGG